MAEEEKKEKPKYPRSRTKSTAGEKVRPSFYAEGELLRVIEEQAVQDMENKSSLLEKLISTLLVSDNGKRMREVAARNGRPATMELILLLSAFYERLPLEKIEKLAKESQRDPYSMVVFLALQGLQIYEKQSDPGR